MLYDGIQLVEGASIENASVATGTTFPVAASIGEIFYRSDLQQLYVYNGSSWSETGGVSDAGDLTGTALAPNVVTSSLTSVGTLGSLTVTGNVTAADPVSTTHLTTKSYVDNLVQGLTWKSAVRAATTANITLSGTQTVDGVALVAGDRVLVKDQSTATQNGVYVVDAGAWTRSADMDGSPDVGEVNGAAVYVTDGTTNGDTTWTQTATITVVGTQAMSFAQLSGGGSVSAGSLTGTTLAANVVNSSLTSVGTITSGTWSGLFGAVSGANLTSLNASNLSSGTVSTARLGSGTANGTTYLRGDNTWSTVTATGVNTAVSGTNTADLVYASVADNDQFRIRVGGTGTNAGWVEFATADDASEPIYFRQYNGIFTSIARTLTLLDSSGNTSIPGNLTISGTGALTIGGGTGTSGQVLTSNGSGAAPTWQDASGGTGDAGTLTGTTLAANVVNSSLTSVGTISTGTWQGTAVGATFGGTGQTTYATGDIIFASAANTLSKRTIGTDNQVLTVQAGVPVWADAGASAQPGTTLPRVTTIDSSANGKRVVVTTGQTVPATTWPGGGAISAGDIFSLYNASSSPITLTADAGLTMYREANATAVGSVTLAARGSCTIWYNTATEVLVSGSVT